MVEYNSLVTQDYSSPDNQYQVNQKLEKLQPIRSWMFSTREECLLAISLLLNIPEDKFEIGHFTHTFKDVLRMIRATSLWTE